MKVIQDVSGNGGESKMTKHILNLQVDEKGTRKTFEVPEEVYIYVRQLEAKIKYGFDEERFSQNKKALSSEYKIKHNIMRAGHF